MRVKLIVSAIVFQILAVLAMLGYAYMPIFFGKEIRVDVALYDPRDLFRGNYVSLDYDFSTLPPSLQPYDSNVTKNGDRIYLKLKQDENGTYIKDDFSLAKPENGMFLAGRIEYNQAKFGIEAFFMPPQKALKMEKDIGRSGAWAILAVMDNGRARIKQIALKAEDEN